MHKYQSQRHIFVRNLLPSSPPPTSLYKTQSQREFHIWKQRKDKLQQYDQKFTNHGHIQRIDKYSRIHPTIYEEGGIKKVLKEIDVFKKAPDHHRNKLASLLWELITVKNRVVPGKTSYLVLFVKQLMNGGGGDVIGREQRVLDCVTFICYQENITIPPMIGMKSLASNLVKQIDLIKDQRKDLFSRKQNSSPNLKSPFPGLKVTVRSKSPTSMHFKPPINHEHLRESFVKKPPNRQSIPSPTRNTNRSSTPVKKSYTSSTNSKKPLFQLEIKINNVINKIQIFEGDDGGKVIERLRSKIATMSSLMVHQIKEMIDEFIGEHN